MQNLVAVELLETAEVELEIGDEGINERPAVE